MRCGRRQGPDDSGNALTGAAPRARLHATPTCGPRTTRSEIVGLGLRGVVAVAMPDAVLVADKSRAQDVKAVVDMLRKAKVGQADDYPRFHRPWGWYETLCLATGSR
jgi:mannose-1-phosphate guanylyltransferase/mannose-6-phosphate isomerase